MPAHRKLIIKGNNMDNIARACNLLVDAVHNDGPTTTHGIAEGKQASLGDVIVVGHIDFSDGRVCSQGGGEQSSCNDIVNAIGTEVDLAEGRGIS